jgi:hypothetical protein
LADHIGIVAQTSEPPRRDGRRTFDGEFNAEKLLRMRIVLGASGYSLARPMKGDAMAREVTTRLVDDLDGTAATATVRFGIDGKQYEVDLNNKNADRLRKALAPFVEVARAGAAAGGARRGGRRRAERDFEPAEVRRWAKSKRIKLSERGRIPAEVVEKYRAAGGR